MLRRFAHWFGSLFEASVQACESEFEHRRVGAEITPQERCKRCRGFTRYETDHAWGWHDSECPGLAAMTEYNERVRAA